MGATDRPVRAWRLLAWVQLILGGLISFSAFLIAPISSLGLMVPMWIMLGGLMAYAYGRKARPLWFWRVFATLLSLYLMWDLGDDVARFLAGLRGGPAMSGCQVAIFFVSVPLNILTCIALLRHAKLLGGRQRSAMRDLESVFA